MGVIVRAYTAKGYHKDIASLDQEQVRFACKGVSLGCVAGQSAGVAVSIDPAQFPEMARFEVLVERPRPR